MNEPNPSGAAVPFLAMTPCGPAPDWPVVETWIELACAPQRAFDYVTMPVLWPTWHPSSLGVSDVPRRPLEPGETVLEAARAAGRRFEILWTVLESEPPWHWVIAARSPRGAARITYRFQATTRGCVFHRTLQYRSAGWPWRVLDANLTHWLLARQSRQALENLRAVLQH